MILSQHKLPRHCCVGGHPHLGQCWKRFVIRRKCPGHTTLSGRRQRGMVPVVCRRSLHQIQYQQNRCPPTWNFHETRTHTENTLAAATYRPVFDECATVRGSFLSSSSHLMKVQHQQHVTQIGTSEHDKIEVRRKKKGTRHFPTIQTLSLIAWLSFKASEPRARSIIVSTMLSVILVKKKKKK